MHRIVRQGLIALLVLSLPIAAAAVGELLGIGKAKMGQSLAEVKKVFPKLEELRPDQNLGAQTIIAPDLTRFVTTTSAPGIAKPAKVELRFWKGKLWAVIAYFPAEETDAVIAALTKQLGAPNGANPKKPAWNGATTSTFLESTQHWYSITDNALSKDAQTWFIEQVRGKIGDSVIRATPAGAPAAAEATAPATPAAATPGPTK